MKKPLYYPYIIRPGIFIAIIASLPFVVVGIFNLMNPPLTFFVVFSGPAVFVLMYAFLFRYKITIEEQFLKNRTFFTSNKIPYEDILKVKIVLQVRGNPPYQMRIFHRNEQARKPIIINIKLFSREDLKILVYTLIEKSPQAELDTATKKIIDGQMPSFFKIMQK